MLRLLAIVLVPSFLAFEAAATVYTLEADGTGDFADLATAVDMVVDGDVLSLAEGLYSGPRNRNVALQGKAITIRSAGGTAAACIIDCGYAGRAFACDSGEAASTVIQDLTIRGGSVVPDDSGGAILCRASSPTISGCVFRDCHGHDGGAVWCIDGARPTLTECLFVENTAQDFGGAVRIYEAGPVFQHCTFRGNAAGVAGGAIHHHGSDASFDHCLFRANQAPGGVGGGLYVNAYSPGLLMVSCTLIENAAGSGGSAIHVVDGSHVELENTDVSGGEPSSGIDGYVGTTCSAGLSCSAVDAARWTGGGTISISYEDCVVETETMTWGEMKSHYR